MWNPSIWSPDGATVFQTTPQTLDIIYRCPLIENASPSLKLSQKIHGWSKSSNGYRLGQLKIFVASFLQIRIEWLKNISCSQIHRNIAKVYFILYLGKFKQVPLPAQHFLILNWDTRLVLPACFWDLEGPRVFRAGMCNSWNTNLKMSYAIYIPSG